MEAWANGPVIRRLYEAHRGQFQVRRITTGNPSVLSPAERETIDAVLGFYGGQPSQWLSDLTHCEDPWKNARRGMDPGAHGNREITHAAMAEYYGGL